MRLSSTITWVAPLPDGVEPPWILSLGKREETPWVVRLFNRVVYWVKGFPYAVARPLWQRLTRPTHTADKDLWNLDGYLAKWIYPKVLQFYINLKAGKIHGYPADFVEYEDSGYSRENYDAKAASGELVGGGMDAWVNAVGEMVFALEHRAKGINYCADTPEADEFFQRYFGETTGLIADKNKRRTYHYYMHDCPDHLSPWMTCGEELTEDRLRHGAKLYVIEEYYSGIDLEIVAQKRAIAGFELLGKYFVNLWD